jgi:hypothetical protein
MSADRKAAIPDDASGTISLGAIDPFHARHRVEKSTCMIPMTVSLRRKPRLKQTAAHLREGFLSGTPPAPDLLQGAPDDEAGSE